MFLTQIRSLHTQNRKWLFLIRIGHRKSPYKILYVKYATGRFFLLLFLREGPADQRYMDCRPEPTRANTKQFFTASCIQDWWPLFSCWFRNYDCCIFYAAQCFAQCLGRSCWGLLHVSWSTVFRALVDEAQCVEWCCCSLLDISSTVLRVMLLQTLGPLNF